MSEISTIARPYAKAIFDLAKEANAYDQWSSTLTLLSSIAEDQTIQSIVENPFADKAKLAEIVKSVCGDKIDSFGANLVDTLVDNGRLNITPAIAERFEFLRAEAEKVVEAEVESALPLEQDQLDKLSKSLETHFGKKVKLIPSVNKELMGGILIRAGDTVIDGSVRTKLEKLASTIRA